MPRPRKSITELKLSGTYQVNKARYARRSDAEQGHFDAQSLQAVRFRAPRHFTAAEKAAHREIMTTCPRLTEADRLTVEVCSQLLAKQRAGLAKPSESNKLLTVLTSLRSRAAASVPIAAPSALNSSSPSSISSRPSGEPIAVNFDAYPHGFVVTGGAEFGGFWDRDEVRQRLMAEGRMTSEQYQNDDALELEELRQ